MAALLPARDILDERVDAASPPSWCVRRGWDDFLCAIEDDVLRRCEAEGLGARAQKIPGAPADLVELAEAVREASALPALAAPRREIEAEDLRAVSARKREQLPALLGAVGAMAAHAARIVDVGAGSGHFARTAAEAFAREVVGIEREPARVAAAEARAGELRAGTARFLAVDALKEPLALARDDLAVGLHACGALGDRLVSAAAEAGCDVALVSCCLQKIDAPARAPLSRAAAGLVLPREVLGLANLTSQAMGVETSIEATMEAREARHALHLLLSARGAQVAPGEEMRGINRRRARHGLADIAALALAQRGLAPADEAEIRACEAEGRRSFAKVRRRSLPRSMLARLLEVTVVLDRAAALEESGHATRVATLFERAVTPRNVALLASRDASRLPPLSS